VSISGSNGSNAGYTVFRGSVNGTGYPLHLSVSTSLPLPCVTVCHHVSTGVYLYQGALYFTFTIYFVTPVRHIAIVWSFLW